MEKEKIKFKDLNGWLKFGVATSIILGILYIILLISVIIASIFFS